MQEKLKAAAGRFAPSSLMNFGERLYSGITNPVENFLKGLLKVNPGDGDKTNITKNLLSMLHVPNIPTLFVGIAGLGALAVGVAATVAAGAATIGLIAAGVAAGAATIGLAGVGLVCLGFAKGLGKDVAEGTHIADVGRVLHRIRHRNEPSPVAQLPALGSTFDQAAAPAAAEEMAPVPAPAPMLRVPPPVPGGPR